jgi:hypothetical protein
VTVWAQQKLTASDGAEFDHFGTSVSVSEDTAVVGATGDDDAGPESGSAYVFARSGGAWTQRQKLTASDAAAGDEFGSSVAVSGDTVMVGANRGGGVTTDSGSAYVYVRSGAMWTQQQELTASDGAQFDDFGWSVSVDGNTAVVGAYGLAAYVFVRSGAVWTQQQKLTPSDSPSGFFGASVSVSGDTAVVGAYYDDDAGARSGSAYVFVRSGGVWTQQQKLTASNAAPGAEFGYSVSVSGETIVVGAAATGGGVARPAYVYVRNGGVWTEQQKLTGSGGGNFGNSVSVSGDIAIIGEFQHHGNSGGSAYIFVRSGVVWVLAQSLLTPDGVDGGAFGSSVSVNGDTAVVGAPGHYELGMIGVGSAYVFSCASPPSCVDAKDCNNHGTCDNGTCMCNSGWTGTDCATPAAEIPAASTWGLVALILAVATAGTCVLRRPRVAWHSALSRVTT